MSPTTATTAAAHNREKYRNPINGEFGEQPRSEMDFDTDLLTGCSPLTDAEFNDLYGDSGTGAPTEDPEEVARLKRISDLAHNTARWKGRSYSVEAAMDPEGYAGDVVVSAVQLFKSGKAPENDAAWTRQAVYVHARKAGQVFSGETRKALVALKSWKDQFVVEHGRTPSPKQIAAWGNQYRDAQPARRRPYHGFWLMPEQKMVNHYVTTDDLVKLAEFNTDPGQTEQIRPDSWGEIATHLAGTHKVHSKKFFAAALCEIKNAPVPAFAATKPSTVSRWRTTLNKYSQTLPDGTELTGAAAAVWVHEQGLDDAGTEAFFGPWGDVSIDEKDDICEVFKATPEASKELWTSAASFTNTENRDHILKCAWDATRPDRFADEETPGQESAWPGQQEAS